MLLEEYLRESGLTKKAFAKLVEISTTNLWKIRKGISTPSLKTAKKIEEFTEGEVTMRELLLEETSKSIEEKPSLENRISELEKWVEEFEILRAKK
ncbi:MAG: hypothetical protein K1060chlam2_00931 [Chlamydiae bacterium]|nr:hypothetical protein [Chlamydiota bacterium]